MVTVLLSGEDYLSTNEPSRFSREFKLEALRRMEAGENVSDLARQLGVSRKSIYQWRKPPQRHSRNSPANPIHSPRECDQTRLGASFSHRLLADTPGQFRTAHHRFMVVRRRHGDDAANWSSRSHDVDIFLSDAQLLSFLDPKLHDFEFDIWPSDYGGDGTGFLKLAFEGIGEKFLARLIRPERRSGFSQSYSRWVSQFAARINRGPSPTLAQAMVTPSRARA
jgi:Transposase